MFGLTWIKYWNLTFTMRKGVNPSWGQRIQHTGFLEFPFTVPEINKNKRAFNTTMYVSRDTVEWMFKELKVYWKEVEYERNIIYMRVRGCASGRHLT